MRRFRVVGFVSLVLFALVLTACEGYSQSGSSRESQGLNGGEVTAQLSKANGSIVQEIEVSDGEGLILDAEVTLSVGSGTYQIELLGANDQVTLSLQARDGETVSGQGQMVVDSFDVANYRVTATEAQDVNYAIRYTFR